MAWAQRIPVSFNRLLFKCFTNLNKARIGPRGELASLLFPLSLPPQLDNTFPTQEVQACAHVTSGARLCFKKKRSRRNKICLAPRPKDTPYNTEEEPQGRRGGSRNCALSSWHPRCSTLPVGPVLPLLLSASADRLAPPLLPFQSPPQPHSPSHSLLSAPIY